jgi:hypothetical protein
MAKPLQEITDAWGLWMVKKYKGGSLRFTESTNYAKQSSLDQYRDRQVEVFPYEPDYDIREPKPGLAASSDTTELTNSTSVYQTLTYQESFATTQSATWTITDQLQIGVAVNCQAFPPWNYTRMAVDLVSVPLSAQQVVTKSETQAWKVVQAIECPPHSRTEAKISVETAEYKTAWTEETHMDGRVAIWFKNKVVVRPGAGEHYLWFIPIEEVINDCRQNYIIDVTGYEVDPFEGIRALARGTFVGHRGVRSNVELHEHSMSAQADQTASHAPASIYRLAIAKDGSFDAFGAGD